MKKSVVFLVAAFTSLLVTQTAQADVLAGWTFQSAASTNNIIGAGLNIAPTQSGVLADLGTGAASASHATATTVWSSPSGNGSSNAWSANNWTLGDYYQFTASSVGFQNITISYDQVGSGTGPGHFDFEYSTDGSTFFPVGSIYNVVSTPTWNPNTASGAATESFSYDLSLITALNNLSTMYFRIVDQSVTTGGSISGGNVGTGGTGRVDNFIINATPVPEPSTIALAILGGTACLLGIRRRR
jgi:hypothetical protein